MRRYWVSILLYLLAVALYVGWETGTGSRWMGFAALAAYSLASLWLSWAAVAAAPRQWLSYIVVWIPAILPLLLINALAQAMDRTDAAALAVFAYLPVIVAFLILPLISTGLLLLRRGEPRG